MAFMIGRCGSQAGLDIVVLLKIINNWSVVKLKEIDFWRRWYGDRKNDKDSLYTSMGPNSIAYL